MSCRPAMAVLAGLVLMATALRAQDLPGPVNLPPPGYAGQDFVDNAGCAFARAEVSGNVLWVARVNQQRQPVCGLAPTFGTAGVAAAPPAAPPLSPRAEAAAEPTPPPAPAPAPAPAQDAAPARAAVPAPAPPRRTAQVPPPSPAAAVPGRQRLTLAQACAGRSGPQPGLIDSRTGLPVDCGPAPVTASAPAAPAATAPAPPAPARLTLAAACARQEETGIRFIDAATGRPLDCAPAAPAPRRLTRAAACAEQASTGVALIDAATGGPVVCPPGAMLAAGPAQGAGRIDPLSAATISGRLAPGATLPLHSDDPLSAATLSGRVWPASARTARPLAHTPAAAATEERVSSMAARATVATGRFVQVGSFADPANAARTAALLRARGLPVTIGTGGSQAFSIVAIGPLAPAGAEAALRAARDAGFADAFLR